MTKTPPCIGKQRGYGPAADFFVELVDALGRGEVRLNRFHRATFAPKRICCTFELKLIGDNQQIKFGLGALSSQFEADSRRGARDDCKFSLD